MKFVSSTDWDEGVAALTERLVKVLHDGQRVLWLVSGGSNVSASVQIMATLPESSTQKLTVMLADERFGPVGHDDSNWQQLIDAGIKPKLAEFIPVLSGEKTLDACVKSYRDKLAAASDSADVIIAQLGIGADGHIAGILPGSQAAKETHQLIVGYQSKPFQRVTVTFPFMQKINAAYVFAFGDTKQQAVAKLQSESEDIVNQPSQILHRLNEAYLYTDQVGANK